MVKKFIILDSNIKNYSGHFYRYALHCLRAAEKRGYETILATNKACSIDELPPNTFPAYTYSMEHYRGLLYSILRITDMTPKALHAIAKVLVPSATDGILINLLLRKDAHHTATFAAETSELFANLQLRRDDVVFLPSSSFVEASAIYDYLGKNPRHAAKWCFMFRIQLSSILSHMHALTPYHARLLRAAFAKLPRSSRARTHFYTDSDQIARDYNLIVPGLFKVVPIPHTASKSAVPRKSDTITVSYMGQARAQKGYHHLPGIIEGLRGDYLEKNRMRFVIQSSVGGAFSVREPLVEKAAVQLQKFDPKQVELVIDSMSDAAYQKMLSGSDIALMPYEPVGYFAQSSGICAEALACGTPVVVPGGCWLSRQFARAVYEYHDGFGKSPPLEDHAADGLGMRGWLRPKTPGSAGLLLDGVTPSADFNLPARAATHLRVKAVFGDSNTAPFFRVHVAQKAEDGRILTERTSVLDAVSLPYATCLFPLGKDAESLLVSIRHVAVGTVLDLGVVKTALFDEDPSSPLSAVGMIYGTVESIRDCLRNIADNYDHYQETARAFSDSYYEKHNADALIGALENGRTVGSEA